MAIKVKAVERKLKFTKNENDPGVYRYVLGAELYTALNQKKVIREAALRSGVSQGVMQACWDAAGEVIKAWATEGHSVAQPINNGINGINSNSFFISLKFYWLVSMVIKCKDTKKPATLTLRHVSRTLPYVTFVTFLAITFSA